ncbi:MAG: cohesin domain-containing protein [Methanophagales archaeon]|nr:cohesin domain-containing protein [Methanophagales archaeon]
MDRKERSRGRRRTSVAVDILLIIIALFIAVIPVIAQAVEVRVNAPEYVDAGATFTVTIDITAVTDLNSAQFDLSFDPDVVKISDVKKGEINGEEFPTFMHRSIAEGTERVLVSMPFGEGVSGSGYLAEIKFKAKGEEGKKSELNLSKGMLGNISAGKISAEWISSEIRIGEEKGEEEEEEEEEKEEVTPGSPNITAWNPAEAVVNNTEGESRAFNITVDQTADISWQINGTEVQTNESTREAVFTNTSAVVGTWNISAIATNTTTRLSDMHTWIWSVTTTAITPTPTLAPGVTPTPTPTPTLAPGETPKPTPTPMLAPRVTPTPTTPATPKPSVPGFGAVFAIVVLLAIAYLLLRRYR